jgi:hypothetical protein
MSHFRQRLKGNLSEGNKAVEIAAVRDAEGKFAAVAH